MDIFSTIWNYDLQIIPISIGILIFIFPSWIRKKAEFKYNPIYFSLIPLNFLNKYIFQIYNTESFDKKAKIKVIKDSVISMILDVFIFPLVIGIVLSFLFNEELMSQFLKALFLILLYRALKSIIDFYRDVFFKISSMLMLVLTYTFYIIIVLNYVDMSYKWAYQYTVQKQYLSLIVELNHLIIRENLLTLVFMGVIINVFSHYLIKAVEERKTEINKKYENYSEEEVV